MGSQKGLTVPQPSVHNVVQLQLGSRTVRHLLCAHVHLTFNQQFK